MFASSSKIPTSGSQLKISRIPVKSALSSTLKGTPSSTAPSSAPFKARTMPNFKAIHDKIPKDAGGLLSADKENLSAAANNALESKRRQSIKGTTHIIFS